MKTMRKALIISTLIAGLALLAGSGAVLAGTFAPFAVTDQTPSVPLANPVASSFQPRYISGFGTDDSFTIFFEDRDAGGAISYASTTSGPTELPTSANTTNIVDTHFLVKDWPITIGVTTYPYRAWGSVGNNVDHHFYVSNDLTAWTLVSTFTIPNAPGFTNAHGYVYYGFHDVIELNGSYYAFAESNQSQTMIVRSANGDDVWEAFASVGGRPGDGPLELPAGETYGWTPSGSFVDLGHDRGYGKIHVDPDDNNFYLAVNTAAQASLPPADLEAAFIDPANWTWHDGTVGPASNPIFSETSEHDLRECWVVPNTDPDADWVIVYDADFGSADGGKALGYATLTPPFPPPTIVYVDDDYDATSCTADGHTWQGDCFDVIQDGVNAVLPGGTVYVAAGTYAERLTINKSLDLRGAQYGVDPTPAGARTDATAESIITEAGLLTPNPDVLIEIPNGVTSVTLDGFTLQGDRFNTTADTSVVRCWDDDVTIGHNIIDGMFGVLYKGADNLTVHHNRLVVNKLGVTVQPNPATNVTISDNLISLGSSPVGEESATYMTGCSGCSVTGNAATGFINGRGAGGSNLNHLTISGNTFIGNKDAVSIWGNSTFITIGDNDLSNSLRYGINIKGQDVIITGNQINNNGDAGISIARHVIDTERVDVFNNSLVGNTNDGVKVDTGAVTDIIDASSNWWGSNAPATVRMAANGGDGVDYTPWLDVGTNSAVGVGFDGDFSTLHVDDDSLQSGTVGRIQEAIDMVSGSTVMVHTGLYDGTINVDGLSNLTIIGENRDTVIWQPACTLSWAIPGMPGYDYRQAAARVVGSTDITLQNLTMDFDLVKANWVHGVLYWDSSGTLDSNVLKNMSVSDTSGIYYEVTSYVRAPSYADASRASVSFTNNTFIDTGRLAIVTHDFVDATISDNTFYKTTADFGYAIELGSRSVGTISGNTIYGFDTAALSDGSNSAGIYVENAFTGSVTDPLDKSVTIADNEIYACQWGVYIGNEFDTYAGNVDVLVSFNDNSIHDNLDGGIVITDEDMAGGSSVTVTGGGNSIVDNNGAGYYIFTWGDGDITVDLSGETISGHSEGVIVEDFGEPSTSAYNVSVTHSNIAGNADYGFNNTLDGTVANGICNWWGDLRGPYHPSLNPAATGDDVSDGVSFQPWLTQQAPSPCDGDGPLVHDVAPSTVPLNMPVLLTAVVDDATTGGSVIGSAEYSLDAGGWLVMNADDGSFFDEVTEGVEADLGAFDTAGVHNVCIQGTDAAGNTGSPECTQLTVNAPPIVNPGGSYQGKEGSSITLEAQVSDPEGDALMLNWDYTPGSDVDDGAICAFGDTSAPETTFTCTDDGTYTLALTASDGINPPVQVTALATIENVVPKVSITTPVEGALFEVHIVVDLAASFTDAGTNDSHTCQISWGDSTVEAGAVSELDGNGTCQASHPYAGAGVYTVQVTLADDDGAEAIASVMVVVYDPSAGFVTGGGWIDSPPGAYMPNPCGTYVGGGTLVVTEDNVGSPFEGYCWSRGATRNNGYVDFVEGPEDPPLGFGSLMMGTTDGDDKAQLINYGYIGTPLADIDSITYATYRNSTSTNPPAQYPAINIEVDYVGDGSSYTTLVWEPIYAYGQSNLVVDSWQTWDTMAPSQTDFVGGWWSTKNIPGVCAFDCFVDWQTILNNNPNAKIKYGFGVNIGSGWNGVFTGAADALTIVVGGDAVTYDFEPSTPAIFTGKATFGFVSKYKKGATVPDGNTEFIFKAADLNFHSASYQWLVVTGSDYARFKGVGTINGAGDYKFMIWAGDDEPDTFRIKIWEEDDDGLETVIYDNGSDQGISGGNIVIHTSKK